MFFSVGIKLERICKHSKGCINHYPWWASLPYCRPHRKETHIRPVTLAEFAHLHNPYIQDIVEFLAEGNKLLENVPYIETNLPKVFWRKTNGERYSE